MACKSMYFRYLSIPKRYPPADDSYIVLWPNIPNARFHLHFNIVEISSRPPLCPHILGTSGLDPSSLILRLTWSPSPAPASGTAPAATSSATSSSAAPICLLASLVLGLGLVVDE